PRKPLAPTVKKEATIAATKSSLKGTTMKRGTKIGLAAVVATVVNFQSAWAYSQAEDLVFTERTPFVTQQTLDSHIRLQGMGGLTLPVSDESNKVGVFKYGQAPAGLPLDYPQSKAEVSLYVEGGTVKDKSAEGDAYTGDIFDAGQSALQGMVALRHGP